MQGFRRILGDSGRFRRARRNFAELWEMFQEFRKEGETSSFRIPGGRDVGRSEESTPEILTCPTFGKLEWWQVGEVNPRNPQLPHIRPFFGLSNIPSFQQTSTFDPCSFQLCKFLSSRVKFKFPTFQLADISTSQVSNFFQLSNFLFS